MSPMENSRSPLSINAMLSVPAVARVACRDILDEPINSLEKQGGLNAYTYRVNGGKIIKFSTDELSARRLKREAFVSRYVYDKLPVPTVSVICGDITVNNQQAEKKIVYAVSDVIQGRDVPPQRYQPLASGTAEQLGDILAALHQIKVPMNEFVTSARQNALYHIRAYCQNRTGGSLEDMPLSFRQRMLNTVFLKCNLTGPEVFCHNDIALDNLRFDTNGRICGLIDFGEACYASPRNEFCKMMYCMTLSDIHCCLRQYFLSGGVFVSPEKIAKRDSYIAVCGRELQAYMKQAPLKPVACAQSRCIGNERMFYTHD